MGQKPLLYSDGEELDSFLEELEATDEVTQIAGWDSGFTNLNSTLNGILPGLYLLIGPPSCGKTAFTKQLGDQVAMYNSVPTIFFSFTEQKKDLRIRTLARLSVLENKDIRRGSSFVRHWYGVPKGADADELPPSWEKLILEADEARGWLNFLYTIECQEKTNLKEIEADILRIKEIKESDQVMVVVDDSQRLGPRDLPINARLPLVIEQLQELAMTLHVAMLATWPDLGREDSPNRPTPQEWGERVASADVVFVLENDMERTKTLTGPSRAITLHIVKNRRGEKATLPFDFHPSFSKFEEVTPDLAP